MGNGSSYTATKYGTWGPGNKVVGEGWNGNFEFNEMNIHRGRVSRQSIISWYAITRPKSTTIRSTRRQKELAHIGIAELVPK